MGFKMYKAGKFWVFSAAVLTVVGAAGVMDANSQIYANSEATQGGQLAATSKELIVNKDNFEEHFNINGAATYDKDTGIATLTPFQQRVSGNISMKHKFDATQDFSISGEINLGANKNGSGISGSGTNRGGDGIGILFHPGDPKVVGGKGGAIGIGGVPNGFGFKFDTYWNRNDSNAADAWAVKDPKTNAAGESLELKSFGAFVKNRADNAAETVVEAGTADPKLIGEPDGNTFKPMELKYTAATKTLTVTYEGKTWSRSIADWITQDELSFAISASTGPALNLQQFRMNELRMTQNVPETPTRPVDEKGNPIEVPADKTMPIVDGFPGDEVEIDIKDIPDIPGYDKPVADENGKVKVKVPEAGKMIDLPYTEKSTPTRPVDEKGNPIEVPAGETMPEVKGEPGDEVELNVDDLPNIPGYEKPKGDENGKVKVKIVDDGKGGKVYDVTYTEKSTPTRPVDEKGNPIDVPKDTKMPDVKGEPGDEVELDVNELPDIPGYAKPEADENGKVKVKIKDDGKGGKVYDVPYTQATPTRPVDEKGNPIDVPKDAKMPEVKGEPGDEVELDVNDLPDIPGYEKPKGDENGKVKVKIVDDGKGGKVYDVTYAEKTTPTRPVDEKGNPIDVPKDTKMPEVKGEPGDEVELDVNDLPDIPGYAKPEADENGKVKVKIKDDGKGGKVYDVPYTQATPTRPVDEKGNPIDVPKDAKMPEVKGEPGDEVELDVNDLPDIPGYEKPKGDENGKVKVKIVDDGKGGKVYDVTYTDKKTPSRPIDEKTGEEIKLPEGKTMPELDGKPGEEVEIDVNDLPDIPGYDKPKGDKNGKIKVQIPEDGKPADVPYTPAEDKKTPSRPVDEKTGEEIKLPEGKTMPELDGKPGEEVEIDVNDLPDIPGYDKPKGDENGKIKVQIPEDGKPADVPYTPAEDKKTPSRPIDEKTGEEIKLPEGKTMPELDGKPGEEVEIDVNDLPDIPGYDKPKGDENGKIKVKVPEDGKPADVPYTPAEDKKTPSRPVDEKTGEEIKLPEGKTMPELDGKPGEEVEIDVNDLPDIPGYDKPKGDENGKIKVKVPEDGKPADVPYTPAEDKKTPSRPVDEKTGEEIKLPEGKTMPELDGKPGEEVEIDVNDLPDIPGYDKPKGDKNGKIKVQIPEDGKSVDVPYTPAEDKKTPSRPVDEKTGEEIKLPEGKTMPELDGKPGEEVEIDVNDLPDIPGYDKPKGDKNGKIKVQIPEDGKPADVPYTPAEDKKTPSRPVDEKTGEEIKLPEGKTMPELDGKPGEEVEIDVNDLPDIPGYDKPKGDKNGKIKVQIPEDGKSVDVPYTPKKNTTPSRPVDKNTGKEIKTDKSFPILEGKPGEEVEIDVNDLPEIPGYDKPKGDKNGKIKVQIPEDGKSVDVPYTPKKNTAPSRPVDKNTGKEIKTDKSFPILEGKPGDVVEIDVNDLPEIPGYDKPKGDKNGKIKVQIPEDGKSVDVPYTPKKNTTPSRPVDKNTGKEIKTDKSFPILEGKPGDVVEIDVNDLPDIPGYDKPKGDKNGKIKVTIPENGMIDFGYTPIEAGKPGQSQQNNNGSKNTPDNNAPQKGKSKGDAAYPNTGSETNALVSALGAAMLALTGLFAGLTKLRKK
ncbi:lectin-like domain-containing protein [Weissella ceti]|uniref:DUF5978 domain-containing protein n=1 Tax=Weissella ceti TaxID=759620 RepID=A0A088GK26_9LACO|nr:KxYKxGKxW signal peptide domain-containing protein [Weissella ceti]AIM62612.1 hypothetical protein WS74_0360 [Weissella ceti]